MPSRQQYRPGIPLAVVALALVALFAGMFGSGHTTPKLGLDLQGGTTVILTPKPAPGTKVTGGQLSTAVDIIRQRVNGLGVSEAEVVRQGDNVVISVPGKGRSDVLNVVGQTAFLTFREIYTTDTTNPPPGGKSVATSPSTAPTTTPSTTPSTTASTTPTATPTTPAPSAPAASNAGRVAASALTGGAALPAATTPGATTPAATTPTPAAATPTPTTAPTTAPTGTAPTAAQVKACVAQLSQPSPKDAKDETAPSACELTVFQALDCAQNDGRPAFVDDNTHHFVAACDRALGIKYLLKPAQIVGTDVSSVSANLQQSSQGVTTGAWVVDLTFKDSAVSKVESITARLFADNQAPLAITLDGVVQSAPSTNDKLGKNVEISGGQPPFSEKDAKNLANVLKYGSLPVPFTPSSVETISATLGTSSLHAGLLAGAIGLALVLLYVFLYYRALGLVTVASLLVSAGLVYGSVTLLGQAINFTLTLAGIAGLIISIGITADSFVVFFERLKDELHEGRSPRQAVEYGWVRARRTIINADVVSILAAVVLYEVSIGSVRGFAFTLGLSTLLDLVVVMLFTKPMMSLVIRYKLFSTSRWSGLASVRATNVPARPAAAVRPASGGRG